MPPIRKLKPRYLIHRQSGRGRAVWTNQSGQRCSRLLPGKFDSAESRAAFRAFEAEWDAAPHRQGQAGDETSVNAILLAFIEHAKQHYRYPDGTLTPEVGEYKLVSRHVRELYGIRKASDFGPLALKAVRQKFIAAGWSRKFINQRIGRVRRMFKWAAGEELIPFESYQRLTAVTGLQRGRTPARETDAIGPVADAVIDATLPFLNRHVRGLVELQRHTGCRPGEAVIIRRADIDTGGVIWIYRPTAHKNSWRGKSRTIAVGPRGQQVLREFFTPSIDDHLFNPRLAVGEQIAERSAKRVTPRYPSHMKRNAAKRVKSPGRPPAERYDRVSYTIAIARACARAFPLPARLAQQAGEPHAAWRTRLTPEELVEVKAWRKLHRWAPNMLRHNFATKVRKELGLEAAQVVLGHARADTTQIYAEKNEQLAATVAAKLG